MKKIMLLSFLFLPILLSACSGQELKELTRVDVQIVDDQENYQEERIIQDEVTLDFIENSFQEIKWEPNTKVDMARREDVLLILFYLMEENVPERLYEYRIWFNGDGSATIISNNIENEGFGTLEEAVELKEIIFDSGDYSATGGFSMGEHIMYVGAL